MTTVYTTVRASFPMSFKARVYSAIFVAGLLVFVYLHWRGQRQVELAVFSVLTALAATLFTIRGEVSLASGSREITGQRSWIGIPVRKIVVRVGSNDALYLTEDITHSSNGQGIHIVHELRAAGRLVSHDIDEPGPYIVIREGGPKNRARLEKFTEDIAESLGVPIDDSRRFTERLAKYRDD